MNVGAGPVRVKWGDGEGLPEKVELREEGRQQGAPWPHGERERGRSHSPGAGHAGGSPVSRGHPGGGFERVRSGLRRAWDAGQPQALPGVAWGTCGGSHKGWHKRTLTGRGLSGGCRGGKQGLDLDSARGGPAPAAGPNEKLAGVGLADSKVTSPALMPRARRAPSWSPDVILQRLPCLSQGFFRRNPSRT